METADLTITIKIDTASARQEVREFKKYALEVLDEIRAAYASLDQNGGEGLPGAKRRA